jgi:DNA-directed RNA polymerase specialized sigma24 family protein
MIVWHPQLSGLEWYLSLRLNGAVPMSSEGSVSDWIARLQAGSPASVQQLWDRYFHRLVYLAREKLRGSRPRSADAEDVALSAFDSFCRHAEQGHFPDLHHRDNLWRLLVVITSRKATHLRRDEHRQKRGGLVSMAAPPKEGEEELGLEQVLSREPDPEFAAQMAEECERLLRSLGDEQLRSVALWKMEGWTVEEIAAKLGYTPRSIKRKLRVIRDLWEKDWEAYNREDSP